MSNELVLVAGINGRAGLQRVGREILRHLVRCGYKVQLIEVPFHTRSIVLDVEMYDIISQSKRTICSPNAPVLYVTVPSAVRFDITRRIVNRVAFEADRIPISWVEKGRLIDLTIVTCSFLKHIWVKCGVPEEKVEVVGDGVNLEIFDFERLKNQPIDIKWRDISLIKKYEHRFMLVAEMSNRKNLKFAVEAFKNAFEGQRNVCLIMKVGKMYPDKNLYSYLGGIIGDIRRCNIFVCSEDLDEQEYPYFANSATHYFTATHGEGWDLNCVEMGALKKIVIAPYHTAYVDYLNDERAWLIKNVKLVPANQDGTLGKLFEGANWYDLDMEETVEVLRKSVSEYSTSLEKAERFYNYVIENLQWSIQVNKLISILQSKDILATGG